MHNNRNGEGLATAPLSPASSNGKAKTVPLTQLFATMTPELPQRRVRAGAAGCLPDGAARDHDTEGTGGEQPHGAERR